MKTILDRQDNYFFALLRIGLWQNISSRDSEILKSGNPEIDWECIYRLACEQTVQGIIADGIGIARANGLLRTSESQAPGNSGKEYNPETRGEQSLSRTCRGETIPKSRIPEIPLEWSDKFLSASAQIVRQNFTVNQVQAKLCDILTESGITYVILKGQGIAQAYPKPMLRCSGDIDFFFTPENYQRAKDLLRPLATEASEAVAAKEQHFTIDDVEIELHAIMYAGINNHCNQQFQTLVKNIFNTPRIININSNGINVPCANFDALYILIHTIRHLGSFGISLRQVIDWTMHIHQYHDQLDWEWIQTQIQQMRLQRLWCLFSQFAVIYLGAPAGDFRILQSNNLHGSKLESLWKIISASGSFGHKNDYFKHDKGSHLEERLSRVYYKTLQALKLRQFDPEFSTYNIKEIIKDTIIAPFRFLFGGKTIQS